MLFEGRTLPRPYSHTSRLIAAAMVSALVTALGVLAFFLLGDGANRSALVPPSQASQPLPAVPNIAQAAPPDLPIHLTGNGWALDLASPSVPASSILVSLRTEQTPSAEAEILDLRTGATVGRLELGPNPWLLLRKSAGELLLSQTSPDSPPQLLVFTTEPFALAKTFTLPNRVSSTTGDSAMALSLDERTLFFRQRTSRCPDGGDAAVCDVEAIGVLSLENGQLESAQLPDNCGFGPVYPDGSSGALTLCPNRAALVTVDAAGATTVAAAFVSAAPTRVTSIPQVRALFGGKDASGHWFVGLTDGSILRSGQPTVKLGIECCIHYSQMYRLANGSLLLGVASYGGGQELRLRSIISVDTANPRITDQVALPPNAIAFAPVNGGSVAILYNDGSLSIANLKTRTNVALGRSLIKADSLLSSQQ